MAGSDERRARGTPLEGDREGMEKRRGEGEVTSEWWSQSAREEERTRGRRVATGVCGIEKERGPSDYGGM